MVRDEVLTDIQASGLIAMLRMPSADDALTMAEALIAGGITCLQVPLTVPGALDVISELCRDHADRVLIGAGTVLEAKDVEACYAAGAQFIVSPIMDLETIRLCNEAQVAVIAGALTPNEVVAALRAGADMVRVYPCGALGGPAYLKFLRAPLPFVKLVPAGGVSLQTAPLFIAGGAAALEVDLDLVDHDALRAGRGEEISTSARLYVDVVTQARSMEAGP